MTRRELVIGTAGHIDHGKTTLIQALTGTDTDRLKEEKARGMTIELGFAFYTSREGTLSFIDVPGHEKLIKTMVSGAIGIDCFLLVVAADEGIMPQTIEHLRILKALSIDVGAVVITKCDRVNPDTREHVKEEAMALLAAFDFNQAAISTFYFQKDKPAPRALLTYYEQLLADKTNQEASGKARLNIDRVFSLKGIGTVVTGTLIEGTIHKNDPLMLYPQKTKMRTKNIQCHFEDVDEAFKGQRVALNVSGDYQDIHKGNVLSNDLNLSSSQSIDVTLQIFDQSLKHGHRVRVLIGTQEVFGRAIIPQKHLDLQKDNQMIKLRLESKITCKAGDHFILQTFSTMTIIGGGRVLQPLAERYALVEDSKDTFISYLNSHYDIFSQSQVNYTSHFNHQDAWAAYLQEAVQSGRVVCIGERYYRTRKNEEKDISNIIGTLGAYHGDNPLSYGIEKAVLKSQQYSDLSKDQYDQLLAHYERQGIIKKIGERWALSQHKLVYNDREKAVEDQIKTLVSHDSNGFVAIKSIFNKIGKQKSHYDIFNNLLIDSFLVKINEETVMNMIFYQQCLEILKDYLDKNQKITVAEYRDLLKLSRKQSIMLLEHFDSIKITNRIENYRILRKR